jgi:hypothetical protein
MTEQEEEITAELVRIYVKEQALSEAGPEPKSEKDSQEPEIERARHGQGGVPQAEGGNHNLNCEDSFVLQH